MKVFALNIESGSKSYEIPLNNLSDFPQLEITTTREKQDELKKEIWSGPLLIDILNKFEITEYDRLQIVAADNYMVRLASSEISSTAPIIATLRNGIALEEKDFRLILPEKRDMFWIRDIARIIVEQKKQLPPPSKLFVAETILGRKPLINNPEPFADVAGYFIRDLLQEVYPMQTGEYWLLARDGVSHMLDFNNYLIKGALIKDGTGFSLQSPQMPAGMWIKDLAYIQKEEIGIIFIDQFQNWQQVMQLLSWQESNTEMEIEFNKMLNEKNDQKREFFELQW